MKKINQYLYNNSLKIVTIFLFLQPVIDVLTAVSLTIFNSSFTLGLITRFSFMIFMIYYYFVLSKSKNKHKTLYLILLFIYILGYGINIINLKGIDTIGYELKSTLKSFYFPIILITLLSFFEDNNKNMDIKKLSKLFIIYALLVLIPNLLGIGFDAYAVTKSGSIGFFYTANEIGAILSILIVFYISSLFNRKKYIQLITSILIILYLLTSIGTKGPLILFVILVFYFVVKYLKSLFAEKKYKLLTTITISFILFLTIFIMIIPKTNFYKNIMVHLEFLGVDSIDDIITDKKVLDHLIFSQRLTFWRKTNEVYMESNISEKILGIGYINNYSTDNVSMKMVEMDFVDIFYRHGFLGFTLYLSSFIIILYKTTKKIIKEKINNSRIETYIISIIFSLVLAFLTGHVITSPSVSIYVALITCLLYNEINRREYENDKIRNSNC